MKSIKSILALFVAVLLMSTATYAQRPTAQGADRGNKMVEMMTKELGLSDAQIERIVVIQDGFTEKVRTMRNTPNSDRTVMREEMKKVASEREAAINNVLTEEQRTKWTAVKAERGNRPTMRPEGKRPSMNDGSGKRPNMGERPEGKRPRGARNGNSINRLQKKLDLSDTQAKELKALNEAHQVNVKELKASGKESKIKRANKKYHKAVKKLLTPEQLEKWTAMKSERKVKKDMLK